MKKHYVLVYPAVPPDEKRDNHQRKILLEGYADRVEKIDLPAGDSVRLPGGLLLLERENADTVLPHAYRAANSSAVTLKLRFLSEE